MNNLIYTDVGNLQKALTKMFKSINLIKHKYIEVYAYYRTYSNKICLEIHDYKFGKISCLNFGKKRKAYLNEIIGEEIDSNSYALLLNEKQTKLLIMYLQINGYYEGECKW